MGAYLKKITRHYECFSFAETKEIALQFRFFRYTQKIKYSGKSKSSYGEVNVYGKALFWVGTNVANVGNFNADNGPNVNHWNRDNGNDNVFVAPLVVSGENCIKQAGFAWRDESIRQASCLFLATLLEVLSTCCFLWLGYLYQALATLLLNLL